MNNSYFTPLDIVQASHRGSEVELLLVQLGGRTEIYDSDDDSDSGRASPYTEMDIEGQQVKESHIYRPRSIHHQPVANGYGVVDGDQEKSPSPFRQRQSVSPVRQLPSLPEGRKMESSALFLKSADLAWYMCATKSVCTAVLFCHEQYHSQAVYVDCIRVSLCWHTNLQNVPIVVDIPRVLHDNAS